MKNLETFDEFLNEASAEKIDFDFLINNPQTAVKVSKLKFSKINQLDHFSFPDVDSMNTGSYMTNVSKFNKWRKDFINKYGDAEIGYVKFTHEFAGESQVNKLAIIPKSNKNFDDAFDYYYKNFTRMKMEPYSSKIIKNLKHIS